MQKINWGILGLGEIAQNFSKGILETSNAKLIATASKNLEKSIRFKDQFKIESKYSFNCYDDLINCKEVDIIYIALPNSFHYNWAIKSIENNKHVLVEKPSTLNFKEIESIEKNLNSKKIFFGEAFMYRYHPQIDLVIDIIKNDEIGNILNMKSVFGTNLLSKKKLFFFDKKKNINPNSRLFNKKLGGGCILDLGCYPSSFSLLISSLIQNSNIQDLKILNIKKEIGETNVDIDASAKLLFGNEFFSEIEASFKTNIGNKSEIYGEKGSIIINDTWLGSKDIIKKNEKGRQVINVKNNLNIYSYQIQNISKILLQNTFQPQYPGMSLKESLLNMKIIDEWQNG